MNNLTKYLTDKNIILNNRHGGHRGHSTTTAILQINDTLQNKHEKNRISVALTTDQTAAFNTVDH